MINKMHIFSGHRKHHTCCRRSTLYTDVVQTLPMLPHYQSITIVPVFSLISNTPISYIFGVNIFLLSIRTDDDSVTAYNPSVIAKFFYTIYQSNDNNLNLPLTCFSIPKSTYFAFKSSELDCHLWFYGLYVNHQGLLC